jgi:hypothetical protein
VRPAVIKAMIRANTTAVAIHIRQKFAAQLVMNGDRRRFQVIQRRNNEEEICEQRTAQRDCIVRKFGIRIALYLLSVTMAPVYPGRRSSC